MSVLILLILLALIGNFLAKEGSTFKFLIRLVIGMSVVTLIMTAMLGGVPYILNLFSEKCPNCKSYNSFSIVEEIIDNKAHIIYKRCKSCGYKKPYK
jgi:hypothetical protein